MNANRPIVIVVDGLHIQENESLLKAEKEARRMVLTRDAEVAVVYVPKRIITRTSLGTRTQHIRGNGRPERGGPQFSYEPPVEEEGAA